MITANRHYKNAMFLALGSSQVFDIPMDVRTFVTEGLPAGNQPTCRVPSARAKGSGKGLVYHVPLGTQFFIFNTASPSPPNNLRIGVQRAAVVIHTLPGYTMAIVTLVNDVATWGSWHVEQRSLHFDVNP